MQMPVKCILLIAIAALMTGCATIVRKDVRSTVIREETVVGSDAEFAGKK